MDVYVFGQRDHRAYRKGRYLAITGRNEDMIVEFSDLHTELVLSKYILRGYELKRVEGAYEVGPECPE